MKRIAKSTTPGDFCIIHTGLSKQRQVRFARIIHGYEAYVRQNIIGIHDKKIRMFKHLS